MSSGDGAEKAVQVKKAVVVCCSSRPHLLLDDESLDHSSINGSSREVLCISVELWDE
jgi:hypothetical protein